MVDVFAYAPAGGDAYYVACSKGGGGVVDEEVVGVVEILGGELVCSHT